MKEPKLCAYAGCKNYFIPKDSQRTRKYCSRHMVKNRRFHLCLVCGKKIFEKSDRFCGQDCTLIYKINGEKALRENVTS